MVPPSCRHILRSHHLLTSPKRINARKFSSATNLIHPAIISGGGPTGLFLSNLLTSYSIPHLLFDKRPQDELIKHPQAHFINLRSMELLRHELPRVYTETVDGMPPVSEWKAFHFGGSVIGGKRLGRVIHPVSESLKIGQTGSADLVTESGNNTPQKQDEISDKVNRVSPCKPAHLAQNKFVSLLLDEARRTNGGNHLHYNEEIVEIIEQSTICNSKRPIITIHTPQNTYQTRYLLACDGVHSFARKHCQISMRGDSVLQYMMNIHFRTNSALSEILMAQLDDQAMLHFVYNQSLIGAFVCHDGHEGEWVLQVPYFPPYQVPEVDFNSDSVNEMIWSGLLGGISRNKDYSIDILSVRSWTMSSQVAERYMNEHQNILLVGDAAHSFPPAGGFGMNTGLQDAHNLAWRLALNLHCEEANALYHDSDVGYLHTSRSNSNLAMYEHDRKPIAIQNAALSVRNYQRTLQIAKACYLDAQHPQLLMSLLGSPPMSFLPLETRQGMFRQLLKVAMLPLASLTEGRNSIHATHVGKNVHKILEKGGSLPLVFPLYELGFSYTEDSNHESMKNNDDSAGFNPSLRVGHRLPHVEMELLDRQINDEWNALEAPHSRFLDDQVHENNTHISLCDISSQLRRWHSVSSPVFSLLTMGVDLAKSAHIIQQVASDIKNKYEISLAAVHVIRHKSDWSTIKKTNLVQTSYDILLVEYLLDVHEQLYRIAQEDLSPDTDDTHLNAFILVRPDGHIANATSRDLAMDLHEQLPIFIEQGLTNSLGCTESLG